MILITGVAGFIGFHLAKKLLDEGQDVVGLDNVNPYYDVRLKDARLKILGAYPHFSFTKIDLGDRPAMEKLFSAYEFDTVAHLAAQAGVRYSLDHPHDYIDSNIVGFLHILEGCRHSKSVKHLVFASSSSVYGANTGYPWSVHDTVDHPLSLYAASKKANELMAHSYSHLYRIPTTGLRFFTVYGPWGRPDMAMFKFTKAILEGKPIEVYNNGQMERDFTYIDDIVGGLTRVIEKPPVPDPKWDGNKPDSASSNAPYRLYNIGNNNPVQLMAMIEIIEKTLGKKAEKTMLPMQPGDAPRSYADIDDLHRDFGFKPSTPLSVGIEQFIGWYREFYL